MRAKPAPLSDDDSGVTHSIYSMVRLRATPSTRSVSEEPADRGMITDRIGTFLARAPPLVRRW